MARDAPPAGCTHSPPCHVVIFNAVRFSCCYFRRNLLTICLANVACICLRSISICHSLCPFPVPLLSENKVLPQLASYLHGLRRCLPLPLRLRRRLCPRAAAWALLPLPDKACVALPHAAQTPAPTPTPIPHRQRNRLPRPTTTLTATSTPTATTRTTTMPTTNSNCSSRPPDCDCDAAYPLACFRAICPSFLPC